MFDIILNLEDLDRKTYLEKFEGPSFSDGLTADLSISNNFGSNPFHEANN